MGFVGELLSLEVTGRLVGIVILGPKTLDGGKGLQQGAVDGEVIIGEQSLCGSLLRDFILEPTPDVRFDQAGEPRVCLFSKLVWYQGQSRTISNLNKKAYAKIEEGRFAKLEAMKGQEGPGIDCRNLSYYEKANESRRRFPDGHLALVLCAERLRHIAGTQLGTKATFVGLFVGLFMGPQNRYNHALRVMGLLMGLLMGPQYGSKEGHSLVDMSDM